MEKQGQKLSQEEEADVKHPAKGLRDRKKKNYKHLCEKYNSKVQKQTEVIHNTYVISRGDSGEFLFSFHQKSRSRKSKENVVKLSKIRREAQQFNNLVQKEIQENLVGHQRQEVKMEQVSMFPGYMQHRQPIMPESPSSQ